MAKYLAEHGVSVHCPLLPGHGHYPDKLHKIPRQAWLDEAQEAFETAKTLGDELFLMGHSMGAVLGANLCLQNPEVRGLIMLTPIYEAPDDRLNWMRFLRYVMPWFYPHKMRSMRKLVRERVLDFDPAIDFDDPHFKQNELPKVSRVPTGSLAEMVKMAAYGRTLWSKLNTPSIIFRGGHDPAVKPGTIDKLYEILPGPDKKLKTFPEAGHEPMRPFDPAHKELWPMALDFIRTYSCKSRKVLDNKDN
jgi:carboxylesterase